MVVRFVTSYYKIFVNSTFYSQLRMASSRKVAKAQIKFVQLLEATTNICKIENELSVKKGNVRSIFVNHKMRKVM